MFPPPQVILCPGSTRPFGPLEALPESRLGMGSRRPGFLLGTPYPHPVLSFSSLLKHLLNLLLRPAPHQVAPMDYIPSTNVPSTNIWPLNERTLCFPEAALTNCHTHGGPKTKSVIVLQRWRPEVQNQRGGRLAPCARCEDTTVWWLARSCWRLMAALGALRPTDDGSASVFATLSLRPCFPPFSVP